MVSDDTLDTNASRQQLRSCASRLVDQQVSTSAVFNDVLIVAGVARDHDRAAFVFDPIADSGLDSGSMFDLKCDHLHSVLLIDDAVLVEFLDDGGDAFWRKLFVLE